MTVICCARTSAGQVPGWRPLKPRRNGKPKGSSAKHGRPKVRLTWERISDTGCVVACHAESERQHVPLGLRGNSTGFRKCGFDFVHAAVSVFGQVVLPDAKHPPTLLAKGFGDKPISKRVGREFLFPEWPVVDRQIGVPWTSMPETAINENNDALPAKSEIRFSKMLLAATPAGDAMRPEKFGKGKFGVLVTVSANAGHDLGAF